MDKFEEYLRHHKARLDLDSPADDTWQQLETKLQAGSEPAIEKKQPAVKLTSRIPKIRHAVAACLIALAGAGLWLVVKKPAGTTATSSTARNTPARPKAAAAKTSAANPNATNPNAANPAAAANATKPNATNPAATNPNAANNPAHDAAANPKISNPVNPNTAKSTPPNAASTKTATAAINPNTTRSANPKTPKSKDPDRSIPNTIDEVHLIDKSYATLINNQLKKLRSTPLYAENSNYFAFYVDQFKQMDHDEQTVRDDIKRYGLTNEFLEQLINVYQQKLNLLKSLQTEVNKMNNKVRERLARPGKPEAHYLNI
jgi:hypothetical protein